MSTGESEFDARRFLSTICTIILHTGEPKLTADGYIGMDVHHAARIMSAGHGGQILLSPTTRQLVEQHLPAGACTHVLNPPT